MEYDIISTGSQGNAVVINKNILIDCGVSFKSLKPVHQNLKLVLLTHIHTDHFSKTTICRLAQERPTLRFGCCFWLVKDLLNCNVAKANIDVYDIGRIYVYNGFKVSPVKLYHDVQNCGYRLFTDQEKALYVTDTAHLKCISAKGYNLYLIEANYEDEELKERIESKKKLGGYIYETNVASRHLSVEQTSNFLLQNMGQQSKYVFLHGHKEK